ncbi:MAG: DUF190 domain-containing protein [Cyanobacteria bacterium J06627_28]
MDWQQLTIYTTEGARWQRQPLYLAVVEHAKAEGLLGAIVTRGIEGFGPHHAVQTTHVLSLSADLPLEIRIIDRTAAIEKFLPLVKEMLQGAMMTLQDINVVSHSE